MSSAEIEALLTTYLYLPHISPISRQVSSAEIEARASEQDILFIETNPNPSPSPNPNPNPHPNPNPNPNQDILFIETSAKEGFNIKLLFRRLATALPNLESSSSAPANDPQIVNLTAPPPATTAGPAGGTAKGCAAGCY